MSPSQDNLTAWSAKVSIVLALLIGAAGGAGTTFAKAPPLKDDGKLFDELGRRGLTEMLELLVKEHPPDKPADAKLALRAIVLHKANAPGLSQAERMKGLTEAAEILEEIIAEAPDDPRRFEWQMDLGHELIYQLAEPSFNNILFKGGTDRDRQRLGELAGKAVAVFENLQKELNAEYDRLDRLDPDAFERQLSTGHVQRIERLGPLAPYFLQWARFYRALALPSEDPEVRTVFENVIQYMSEENQFTRLDHSITGVQAQALWITGTAQRLVGQFDAAIEHLSQAIAVVEKLPESARRELRWVLILGRLEQVKTRRDQGQFDEAIKLAQGFRAWAGEHLPENFAVLEAVAVLEGTIFKKQAEALRAEGDNAAAEEAEAKMRKPLIDLARSHPAHQSRLYDTVYSVLGPEADPQNLDAFEKSALVFGLLREATALASRRDQEETDDRKEELARQRMALLDRAIDVGEMLLRDDSELAGQLRPNALFTLALSYYQRGQGRKAVERFIELLEQFPDFDRASAARASAVQLAHEQMRQADGRPDRMDQDRFVTAARLYLDRNPPPDEAARWRLLLARTLEAVDKTAEAAAEYDRIPETHPRKLDARFFSLQLQAQSVDLATGDETSKADLQALLNRALDLADDADARAAKIEDPQRKKTLEDLSVSATLMAAEICATPALEQWDRAWDTVEALEQRANLDEESRSRALRIRILARQRQGRVAEALQLALSTDHAGSVVQGLLQSVRGEIARERRAGRKDTANKLAREAVSLARQLYNEAKTRAARPDERAAITLSLAEAHLEAGQYEQALERFRECEGKFPGDDSTARRRRTAVQRGQAEALYQAGKYAEALPLFGELWRGAEPDTDLWWRALLRNLQCHHALKHDPGPLRKSILQHRHRYQQMGGPEIKAEFDKLLSRLQ